MFTNTLKFLYFLSPINFMSSYIFNVIIYFYLSPVHIENAFKFSNLILHCQQNFYFLIYFQKKNVCYILSKIRWCSAYQLSFTFAPSSKICTLHTTFPSYTFFTKHFFHLHFDPIFQNFLSNLLGKDSTAT
jgi:hypothetical protein